MIKLGKCASFFRYFFNYISIPKLALSIISTVLFFTMLEAILQYINFSYISYDQDYYTNYFWWLDVFEEKQQNNKVLGTSNSTEVQEIMLTQTIYPKGENTLRVAILGGSSVYNLGKAELLNETLNSATSRPVDIVNLGLWGQSSHALNRIVDQTLPLDIDYYLIYSGHNEFLTTSLNTEDTPLSLMRKNITYKYRVVQFIDWSNNQIFSALYNAGYTKHPTAIKKSAQYLNVFSGHKYTLDEKHAIYIQYESNLNQIVRKIKSYNSKIILSTVTYNRMEKPWYYDDNPTYGPEFSHCNDLYNTQKYKAAKECYEVVILKDDSPNRADNKINQILIKMANQNNIPLVDADNHFITISENNIPGPEFFNDHCHLHTHGNAILQGLFADAIISDLSRQQ